MQNNIQPCVMPNLAFVKNGQAVTTTFAISQWANRAHKDVIRIVNDNLDAIQHFGEVSFETNPVKTKSGTQRFKIATLNYDQACFVICSMRNNKQTKNFKVELLLAFRKCREQLANARKTYSDEAVKRIKDTAFEFGYETAKTTFNAPKDKVTTRELVSEHNNFAFGISKNSLMYEYLKVMRKIKANKEQWQQEVEEFNSVVGDACELSENCEKIKV
jgi:phage regulator Rha-like protein